MIPVGYMYKTIIHEPHWLKAANVDGIYSLSGCISKNFTDYIKYWKHNGYWLFNSPAVMEEIAWFDMNGTQRERDLAANVLEQFHEWQLDFFEPSPVADAAARRFALNLIQRRLLPVREKTDGRILGQTAWAQIPVLVTSDRHLLGMDAGSLRLEFERVRLFPVTPAHPKRLLWALH